MKQRVRAIFYSFPVQLLLLHFKKFQVLILFWFILFSAVNGSFMENFGVYSLYLSPEYLDDVNAVSTALVGISIGMFIMSWNITSFILFSRHFKFLATTTRPFLKYCINNAVIPLLFLVFYFFKAIQFDIYRELIPPSEIFVLIGGFLMGLIFIIAVSFLYFFRADVNISRRIISVIPENQPFRSPFGQFIGLTSGGSRLIKVTSYLDSPTSVKAVRDVSHYPGSFIENIFSRHHFVARENILGWGCCPIG